MIIQLTELVQLKSEVVHKERFAQATHWHADFIGLTSGEEAVILFSDTRSGERVIEKLDLDEYNSKVGENLDELSRAIWNYQMEMLDRQWNDDSLNMAELIEVAA